MRIGILARRSGCKVDTIRYFEKQGLLTEPPRTLSGHRKYCEHDVERVRLIARHLDTGTTLSAVRELMRRHSEGESP